MSGMDTAEKRLSTMDWDSPFMPGIEVPTSSPGSPQRMHGVWTYALAAAAAIPTSSVPYAPARVDPTRVLLAPKFTAGPVGVDPYRPWVAAILDGNLFIANGFDLPKRWDTTLSTWASMGSVVPATGGIALTGAGTAIPNGRTPRYYLVYYNSRLGKETAPQSLSLINSSGSTQNYTIGWTPSEAAPEFDFARIYRATDGTGNFLLGTNATVAIAAGTYNDVYTDAQLNAVDVTYVPTDRETYPPRFIGISVWQGKLFGWVRGSEIVCYAQGVRLDSRFVADDFPDANLLPIGADEGTGDPTAMYPYYGSAIWWKASSTYEQTGSDVLTWAVQRLNAARGAFNMRCVVPLVGRFICLDALGVYEWTPGAEPVMFGTQPGKRSSPFQPVFDRMNSAASNTFHSQHFPAQGIVVFYVALDFEPIPNAAIVCDYAGNRFVSLDLGRWSCAAGFLEDRLGALHPSRGEDMGYLWEDDYGNSEGVLAGDVTGTLSSFTTGLAVACVGSSFNTTVASGLPGAPVERYDSSLNVVDVNRVYSASSAAYVTYLYPSTAFVSGDTIGAGVIAWVIETGSLDFDTPEAVSVRDVIPNFENVAAGDIRFDVAKDDADFGWKGDQAIDGTSPISGAAVTQALVPMGQPRLGTGSDICWSWAVRASHRRAGESISVRTLTVHFDIKPGMRTV